MGAFDAPVGGSAVNLTSGSQPYQDTIVSNAERQLKPRYKQALQQTRQSWSDKGQLGGGEDKAAQLGLQENYLNDIGGVAEQAATKGADVAENQRLVSQQHDWQTEARDKELNRLDEIAKAQRESDNANMWANLIGEGALAVGTGGGSLLAKYLAKAGKTALSSAPDDGMDMAATI